MFTFLHDIAKPFAEISKMHLVPVWPTKIILRLLAQTYLLRQTSYLQRLFSVSKTSMATAKKMIWQALQKRCSKRRRSRNWIFCVCTFQIHPEQYAKTCMAVLITRVTGEGLFSFWGQRKVLSCKIYLRGLPPCFFHGGSERLSFFGLRPSQQPF